MHKGKTATNCPEALKSKAVAYCFLEAGQAFNSPAYPVLYPLAFGKGTFLDCKGLLCSLDVCDEG